MNLPLTKQITLYSAIALVLAAAIGTPFYLASNQELDAEAYVVVESPRLPPVAPRFPAYTRDIPDFAAITDINERKIAFFLSLLPAITFENTLVLEQRRHLLRLTEKHIAGQSFTNNEQRWLHEMARYYRVVAVDIDETLQILARRVDIIPDSLVLIQAANESGWGTSRFALDARNFFGQWCWTQGCGIVPAARPDGAVHEIRYFDSLEASVRSYMRNLNTHPAYQDLRAIRAELRDQSIYVTAQPLTLGLEAYSERGLDYIDELNQMIRVNRGIIQEARAQFMEQSSP